DRRRPGALLVRREAVLVARRAVVAVAGIDVGAGALGVVPAAQQPRVHRGRRLLDRAHVVEDLAVVGEEVGVVELDRAAGGVGRAGQGAPGILDQALDRLAGPALRADPHHFDARDAMALVARVVALAAAQPLETLGREPAARHVGAAGLLLQAAGGAHAEERRLGELRLAAHRHHAARRVQQVEPQQDALAARAVDGAPLERRPDRVAAAALGVQRDQAAGQEEGGLALEVEELELLQAAGGLLDGHRPRRRLAQDALVHALVPFGVARAARLRVVDAAVLLVAG